MPLCKPCEPPSLGNIWCRAPFFSDIHLKRLNPHLLHRKQSFEYSVQSFEAVRWYLGTVWEQSCENMMKKELLWPKHVTDVSSKQ